MLNVNTLNPVAFHLIAIPKKTDDVPLVLDRRVLNTALVCRRVQIPSVDEILCKMEGATVLTEVDLSQEYLQLTLAEESSASLHLQPGRQTPPVQAAHNESIIVRRTLP